ncbi:MAG TPA: hypothetical protein DCY63_03255 [Acidimicrobiaceae bacterium]|nr:hypothetical protein [Acidimicrobiaceae bacterium]
MRIAHIFIAMAACPIFSACGSTYIDESLLESSTTVAETVEVTEVPDRTFSEHLDVIDQSLNDLSDAIVDNDGSADVILATILESWNSIEAQIKTDFADSHFGFYEVMVLTELSVERRRPADASKAWKLFIDIAAAIQ